MKCKTCGKNSESLYCFQHKPKKPLSSGKGFFKTAKTIKTSNIEMKNFFIDIWKKRNHTCEVCNCFLGKEPKTYMFDHILEKSKYPQLTYKEDNIMILCLSCHDNKTRGFISDIAKEKILLLKSKYDL